MIMKQHFSLLAGALVICCLTGCLKAQPVADDPEEEFVENALVFKPGDGSESVVYPLGSAFSKGALYVDARF